MNCRRSLLLTDNKLKKVIVDPSLAYSSTQRAEKNNLHDYAPNRLAGYWAPLKGLPAQEPIRSVLVVFLLRLNPRIQEYRLGVIVFPRNSETSDEWTGRTRQPMRVEPPPTGAANANLKAPSRAWPAGVRHPLTSLPSFISALTCSVFFSGNGTSESQRLKSDRTAHA